jgi:cytochrome o ubiquinol oxidase subunit 3
MTAAALPAQGLGRGPGHVSSNPGPASKRIVVAYGFWIFLLSDIVMFSAIFAAYAVLSGQTADGPTPRQLFDLHNVGIETGCLLASSFTCGICAIAIRAKSFLSIYITAALTFILGFAFLLVEFHEFSKMIAEGAAPQRSAFLSAFFALVGCHGLHVTLGLSWLIVMMVQIATRGLRADVLRRFLCFTLFWHALDIIWVALFTVVYLMGAR